MKFAMHRACGLILVCMLALGFTAGCQSGESVEGDAASEADSAGATSRLPALHVVLAWESHFSGENWERKNYRVKLDACRGSGWPMRALSPEDEAKLGTGQVEIMIDAHRQYARQVSWTLGADGDSGQTVCLSKLEEHRDEDAVDDATGMYEAIDEQARAQQRQLAQVAGWKLAGEGSIKGQPCSRWQNDKQEVCMWSGGTQWGFNDAPADAAGCTIHGAGDYLTSIPLEARPLAGGSGCILQVKSFSLGKGLIPSNQPGQPIEGKGHGR